MKRAFPGPKGEEVLLFCDNLRCQVSDEFKRSCKKVVNARIWTFPTDVTDLIQPIDAGWGRDMKREIGLLLDKWLEWPTWQNGKQAS
jgi:hypothetical protein